MEDNLPIDIHYNKLQDWLLSRRHCEQNWHESVLKLRQMINVAIQDMPADARITELLQGTYINYFNCKEIVEILKQTEGSSKTLFGSYSSKRLQDWVYILKCYEKDNIFLAEAAQLLTRCVNYDIPSQKKQINKFIQAQQECFKKETDYHKSSIEMRDKFNSACKSLGIEGKKLKRELCELLNDLPKFYDEVAEDARNLQNEMDFYSKFVNFLSSGLKNEKKCLPMLRHLIEQGNTTVYEWNHGIAPENIMKTKLDFGADDEPDDTPKRDDEIDWGNLDLETAHVTVIDGNAPEIDWGIQDVGTPEIIQLTEDKSHQEEEQKVARGDEACCILEFIGTRNIFLDDLYEMEAFFNQHSLEMKSENSSNFMTSFIFQSAPMSLQVDVDKVDAMRSNVKKLIDKFSQPKIKELFLICSFPRYVDRLVGNLIKTASMSEKMDAQSKIMAVRHKEAVGEQHASEPKLQIMRMKTKLLKKQVEGEISQKYKNRKVNIMGEINSI